MNVKKTILLLLLLLLLAGTGYSQVRSTQELNDQLDFLSLSDALPSRGQLGGLVVDRLGYIYVANFLDAVWRIAPDGKVKLLSDGLYGSSGNTLDAQGNLYQANFFGNSIVKIDRFGNISNYVEKGLSGPVGMIFDQDHNLFVCNCSDNTIAKVDTAGQISTFAKGSFFSCPNGIARDQQGNFIVLNFNSDQVIRITPAGETSVLTTISGGGGNAHIVAYNDNFYITKIKIGQVYRMAPDGQHALLAGTGKMEDHEGPALQASLASPNGIGVDAQTGTLYVNTLRGEWTSPQPTSINISRIKLVTLRDRLLLHIEDNDTEAAVKTFWEYKNDPLHAHEDLVPAMTTLGWNCMARRKIPAAIALFKALSEAYSDRWQPYYNLGEVYKIIGQPDQARAFYQQALAKAPDNELVLGKLNELK